MFTFCIDHSVFVFIFALLFLGYYIQPILGADTSFKFMWDLDNYSNPVMHELFQPNKDLKDTKCV